MCENIYVYRERVDGSERVQDGLFRSSGEHEKSISLYFTDCFVRAVPVCVSRLPPVSYRYRLQFLFIPARIIPVLNPSICSVVDAVNRPRNVPTSW
jgi:hypothetical protein